MHKLLKFVRLVIEYKFHTLCSTIDYKENLQ